jgi:hypothetical protein
MQAPRTINPRVGECNALLMVRPAVWIECCDVPTHMGEKIFGADQSNRNQPVQVTYRTPTLEVTSATLHIQGIAIAYC